MSSLAAVAALVAGAILVVVVLLQEPKGGALPGVFGGAGDEILGATAARGARRVTKWLAIAWIGACLVHALSI